MKRLPFALLALSLSAPAVACLSASSDDAGSSADDISDVTQKACNFNYTAVATPTAGAVISAAKTPGLAPGLRVVLGDFDGDGKADFASTSADGNGVQLFTGSGDGHFAAGATTAIPVATGRTRVGLATLAAGDFDGDGVKDVVILDTSTDTTGASRGDFSVLYGTKGGALAIAGDATAITPVTENSYYQIAGDLDGDGRDDFVYTTLSAETVAFGRKTRTFTAGKSGLAPGDTRGLAFIAPKTATKPAALVIQSTGQVSNITFDHNRNPAISVSESAIIPSSASRFGTDLDMNGQPEVTVLDQHGLSIKPVGAGAALSIPGFPGRAIGGFDLAGNKMGELVYIVNESQVFAACGYAAGGNDLAAVALPITYGSGTFIAGSADLNNDQQVDFVTVDPSGAVSVYLGAGQVSPPPPLTVFTGAKGADGGTVDASAVDATTADASIDEDGGSDATDASVDASDGGHRGGGGGHVDAGGSGTQSAGNGEGTEAPPDDEGSGVGDPSTRPSSGGSSEGTPLVAVIPTPQTVAACSATPGQTTTNGLAFAGLGLALALGARRRRAKR